MRDGTGVVFSQRASPAHRNDIRSHGCDDSGPRAGSSKSEHQRLHTHSGPAHHGGFRTGSGATLCCYGVLCPECLVEIYADLMSVPTRRVPCSCCPILHLFHYN